MVSSGQGTTRLITMRMMTWIFTRCLASFWHFARAFGSATFEFQLSLRASGKVEWWTDGRPSENPIQLISESSNSATGRSMPMSCYLLEGYESCKFPIFFLVLVLPSWISSVVQSQYLRFRREYTTTEYIITCGWYEQWNSIVLLWKKPFQILSLQGNLREMVSRQRLVGDVIPALRPSNRSSPTWPLQSDNHRLNNDRNNISRLSSFSNLKQNSFHIFPSSFQPGPSSPWLFAVPGCNINSYSNWLKNLWSVKQISWEFASENQKLCRCVCVCVSCSRGLKIISKHFRATLIQLTSSQIFNPHHPIYPSLSTI